MKPRFGLMSMQLAALAPSGIPPEQALSALMSFDIATLARRLAAQGFDPVELGGDLAYLLPGSFSQAAIERLSALRLETGLGYTVHLPLWSLEPSTFVTPVRQGSLRALVDFVRLTLPLQPEVYVLHATGALAAEFYRMRLPKTARALALRQFQAASCESLQALLVEFGLPARRLAIETIEFPLDLTLELAEDLDLSICFDTGHVLAHFTGEVDFWEALERCLPRLAEVHLHDCPIQKPGQIGYGLDHQPLGKGGLDVGRFLQRLELAGFNGPLVFELREDEARQSLDHLRTQGYA